VHPKATLIKWLKLFGGDTRRAIVGYILVALIVMGGGVVVLTKTALNWLIQIANISTPLWATVLLILLCCLYTRLKLRQHQKSYKPPNIQEELHEEFGVYWNNQYKLRCLKCKWPLKCASKVHDPSIFFCSNCDTKHALRDKNGNHLTEAQAIEQLKKLPTSQ
jgi:hypothetical protein